jgi:anti-sigma regulatory factor (Ser/Thr protein kinase)
VAVHPYPVSGNPAWSFAVDDVRAAVDARTYFVRFLRSIQSRQEFIDSAELVFGELLGNVVRHAPGPIEVWVELDNDCLIMHVADSGPALSTTQWHLPEDALSERGRGLFIVAQLVEEIKVEQAANGGNCISVTMPRSHDD